MNSPVVTVNWLHKNLNRTNLIVLDATIAKVGGKNSSTEKKQIPNAIFFDLKNTFLNTKGKFPNTIPRKDIFENEVQKLGINNDSFIVVYDDLGVYSSPRVWWLFKVFGFKNIAVLNGGLPKWIEAGFRVEHLQKNKLPKGNFLAVFNKSLFTKTQQVFKAIQSDKVIIDARSKGRFYATEPEPRKELRGGHIPSSISLPYTELQENGVMKSKDELKKIFSEINSGGDEMIFSCGSGITACILALGATIVGCENYSVYDGSWTEWASTLELPVEK